MLEINLGRWKELETRDEKREETEGEVTSESA
jgi:hypothetical protein